jgi:alpha-methylacyl-CoA racemase
LLEGTDACFAPVLNMSEAPQHPHNVARGAFIEVEGILQNAPAPRFNGTPAGAVRAPAVAGADTEAVLRDSGFTVAEIAALHATGAL